MTLPCLFFARRPRHAGPFLEEGPLVNVNPIIANAYVGTGIEPNPDDIHLAPTRNDPHFVSCQPPCGSKATTGPVSG